MDLIVRELAVSLDERRVLHGIDAVLEPGRVTAILGPNGSGKSTLVRALAGLLDYDAGEVKLDNRHIGRIDPRDRARLIGYLPQDGEVHWNLSVRDLVELGRMPHRSPFAALGADDRSAIEHALLATDSLRLADRRVDALSGGERARVLLARVLAGEPKWLLADEPLASLDPMHQLDMLDQLRRLAAEGMGVVLVLHDLVQAARAADSVLLLNAGRIVAHGPPREALAHGPIRTAFGVEVMMVPDADGHLLPVPMGRVRPLARSPMSPRDSADPVP